MKKYHVTDKKTGNLLLTFITYDKKIDKVLVFQFKKLKSKVNIIEVEL